MLKKLIFLISVLLVQINIAKDSKPKYANPIHLLSERHLGNKLKELYAQNPTQPCPFSEEQLAYLNTPEGRTMIHKASGNSNSREIGHDAERKKTYVGTLLKQPEAIILTFSGNPDLEATVAALKAKQLAHNFIIAPNGAIHPCTKPGESVDDALTHRLFSVGETTWVNPDNKVERDLNALAISISIVGDGTKPATDEQTEALCELISYLEARFEIPATNLLDYGRVASPSGRRNTNPLLPWQTLAEKNLAIWPKPEHAMDDTITHFPNLEIATLWISLALRKIGFECPPVHDHTHPDFIATIKAFREHYGLTQATTQELASALNSLIIQFEKIHPKLQKIAPPSLPTKKNDASPKK